MRVCWAGQKERRSEPGWATGAGDWVAGWAGQLATGLPALICFFSFSSSFLFPLNLKLFEFKFRIEFKTLALKQNENHAPA
jgi:hypothetical protein